MPDIVFESVDPLDKYLRQVLTDSRIPSAACGTVGLKPAYAELPCDGIVPLSTTCDHVGPMTRTVGDAKLMFEVIIDVMRKQ